MKVKCTVISSKEIEVEVSDKYKELNIPREDYWSLTDREKVRYNEIRRQLAEELTEKTGYEVIDFNGNCGGLSTDIEASCIELVASTDDNILIE